jgi:hypothetical protein
LITPRFKNAGTGTVSIARANYIILAGESLTEDHATIDYKKSAITWYQVVRNERRNPVLQVLEIPNESTLPVTDQRDPRERGRKNRLSLLSVVFVHDRRRHSLEVVADILCELKILYLY